MPSAKLYAKSILRDIQAGLGDVPIMEKYQIAPSEYMRVLEKFKHVEIARKRRALVAQSVSHDLPHMRALPRCYIFREVCVYDAKAPGKEGKVNDMTESGLQLAGIESEIGDVRTLTVVSDHAGTRSKVSFEAVCRWVQNENDFGESVAGFEITRIADDGLLRLRRLIQELTLCDWDK
jgi:hypothetical protein